MSFERKSIGDQRIPLIKEFKRESDQWIPLAKHQ